MKFLINSISLLSGLLTTISGFVLQLCYHLRASLSVWGLERGQWSELHRWAGAVFVLSAMCHVWIHRRWYGAVLGRRLLKPGSQLLRRNSQLLTLSLLMGVSSALGLLGWLFEGAISGAPKARFAMIEIHDKLAIILTIYLILHFYKRVARYLKSAPIPQK